MEDRFARTREERARGRRTEDGGRRAERRKREERAVDGGRRTVNRIWMAPDKFTAFLFCEKFNPDEKILSRFAEKS